MAKFGLLINGNTAKLILYYVLLTFDIHRVGDRYFPQVIRSVTAILSRVRRPDVAKDELWSLVHGPGGYVSRVTISKNLEPGVGSCWFGITAAAQSHWTALLYFTRGTWINIYVFRPIWRNKGTCKNSIYINDYWLLIIIDHQNHNVAKFWLIINANTVKLILYYAFTHIWHQ